MQIVPDINFNNKYSTVDKERTGSKRPDWCLFGKVSQNLETLLFKEKFIDWPDSGRMIKVKGQAMEVNDSKVTK